tara:strand:- start:665 stop:883 length:219 start_codon:yes stop_codon:yes gene_type:complete
MNTNAAHWAWMINVSICNPITDATASEAAAAMRTHKRDKGATYAREFRLDAKWIDSDDREALARIIQSSRAQ